jgi:hypothetical protein
MPVLRRLITALLLFFCLVPLGTPLGMVLCLGADGHIAFEPVHDRAHGPASPAIQRLLYRHAAATLPGIEHAAPCADFSFFAGEGGARLIPASDSCPKPETPAFVPVLLAVSTTSGLLAPSLLPDDSLPRNHSLTILRSVLLHI